MADERGALLWVAWAVAQNEAIELILREVVIPLDYRECHPAHVHETPDNVVPHAAVDCEGVSLSTRSGFIRFIEKGQENLPAGARDLGWQVHFVGVIEPQGCHRSAARTATLPKMALCVRSCFVTALASTP